MVLARPPCWECNPSLQPSWCMVVMIRRRSPYAPLAAVMVLECGRWRSDSAAVITVVFDHSPAPPLNLQVPPPIAQPPSHVPRAQPDRAGFV
jgi:hypothetical protein